MSGWERRQRRKAIVDAALESVDLTTPPRTPDPAEDEEEDDQSWGNWGGTTEEWNEEVEQQKKAKERARGKERYERSRKDGEPSYEALEEVAKNAKARLLQSKHKWQTEKNIALGACVPKLSVPCPKPPPKAMPCPKLRPTKAPPLTIQQRLTGTKPPPPYPPPSHLLMNKKHLHPPPPAADKTKAGMSKDEAFDCMDQFHEQADKGPDAHRADEHLEEELKRMACEKLTCALFAAERQLREAASEVKRGVASTCPLPFAAQHKLDHKKMVYRQLHVRCGTWGMEQTGYPNTDLLRARLQEAANFYCNRIVEDEQGEAEDMA